MKWVESVGVWINVGVEMYGLEVGEYQLFFGNYVVCNLNRLNISIFLSCFNGFFEWFYFRFGQRCNGCIVLDGFYSFVRIFIINVNVF